MNKARPIILKTKRPTLAGNLGHLNAVFCPRCKHHIFSYYDKEFYEKTFKVWNGWNYCSKCGLLLDLDAWKDPNGTSDDNTYTEFIKNQM